jgi:hypothetical protein
MDPFVGDREDLVPGDIDDRRAGDADGRRDVAARQRGRRHRRGDTPRPDDLAGRARELVDAVGLGRDEHVVADRQGRPVDLAVEHR